MGAAIRQQSLNLLTAPSIYLAPMGDGTSHGAEYVTQHGISRFITVLGVKQLEIIDVCKKDHDGLAICAFQEIYQIGDDVSPIEQYSESI